MFNSLSEIITANGQNKGATPQYLRDRVSNYILTRKAEEQWDKNGKTVETALSQMDLGIDQHIYKTYKNYPDFKNLQTYIAEYIKKPGNWGERVVLQALSNDWGIQFEVYFKNADPSNALFITPGNGKKTESRILLLYTPYYKFEPLIKKK